MSKYLTYKRGGMNLILSAPHSGELSPKSIPARKTGQRLKDGYTDRIIKGLLEYFDWKPYYVYANIHRSRVDLNRDLEEAVEKSRRAKRIWYEWDTVLWNYVFQVSERYRKTLYVDIHSHNDSQQFHLGYGISKKKYMDIAARRYENIEETSLDAFSRSDEYDMLFGEGSVKYNLEKRGYKVHIPNEDDVYFSGGRNVRTYKNNKVGGIQLEIPTKVCDRDLNGIILCLGDCIQEFKDTYVDDNPRVNSE